VVVQKDARSVQNASNACEAIPRFHQNYSTKRHPVAYDCSSKWHPQNTTCHIPRLPNQYQLAVIQFSDADSCRPAEIPRRIQVVSADSSRTIEWNKLFAKFSSKSQRNTSRDILTLDDSVRRVPDFNRWLFEWLEYTVCNRPLVDFYWTTLHLPEIIWRENLDVFRTWKINTCNSHWRCLQTSRARRRSLYGPSDFSDMNCGFTNCLFQGPEQTHWPGFKKFVHICLGVTASCN
jgi:hypothetical protein